MKSQEKELVSIKLASRDFQPEDSKIPVNGHVFGDKKVIVEGDQLLDK